MNKALQNKPEDAIKGGEGMPEEKKEELAPTPTVADTKDEADALTTPPDSEQPAGVLSTWLFHPLISFHLISISSFVLIVLGFCSSL